MDVASCKLARSKFKLRVDLFFKLLVSEPKRERDFNERGGVDFRLTISFDCERTGFVTILKLKAKDSSDLKASQWVICGESGYFKQVCYLRNSIKSYLFIYSHLLDINKEFNACYHKSTQTAAYQDQEDTTDVSESQNLK